MSPAPRSEARLRREGESPESERVGGALLGSTFLRSLVIQGSWNYRTMLGAGFAFALLPLLRHACRRRGEDLETALARHSELFNAHPYLAGVALGAVARLELDGEEPEVVRRFKGAVRGPLGALGDVLVWAGWLPTTLLVALILAWGFALRGPEPGVGRAPVLAVLAFLALYNVGHLGLRVWAFRVGFREGVGVGVRLREAALGRRAEALHRVGALLLGLISGILLVSPVGLGGGGRFWSLLAIAAFALGLNGGLRVWRPSALAVVAIVFVIFLTRVIL